MSVRNSATVVARASRPPRLRVGLPALKGASLVARRVSEGTWALWLAVGRVVAVLSQNHARLFSCDGALEQFYCRGFFLARAPGPASDRNRTNDGKRGT